MPTLIRRLGVFAAVVLLVAPPARAELVPVRQTEGLVHGFLTLRSLDGATIADGDLTQSARGDRVTTRLIFRFRDGSLHDETAVFTQREHFRLASHHLVQKGPRFPQPLEMSIDVATGQVDVRYTDDDGEARTASERMELPPDLANGLILTLLKNAKPDAPPASFSYIAATPKPRLVKLDIGLAAPDRFATGRQGRSATHYVVKVALGGLTGLLAPLVGKQPPDSHVWVLGGEAPAFVKSEQALYVGGPIWRIELANPAWPKPKPSPPAARR